MKNYLRQSKAITLIALVITIIVLLILAGVTIASLTGDNGLLARTVSAKENAERAEIIENAKIDVLAQITENKGEKITKAQLKTILSKYFENINTLELPDDLSNSDIKLNTNQTYGNFKNIALTEIYNGTFSTTSQIPEITENRWTISVKNGAYLLKSGRFYDDGYFYFDGDSDPQGSWSIDGDTLSASAWGMTLNLSWDGEKFVGETSFGGETVTATLSKINTFKFKIDGTEYLAEEECNWRDWLATIDAKRSGYKEGIWNNRNVIKNSNDDTVLKPQSSSYVILDDKIQPGANYTCGTPVENAE